MPSHVEEGWVTVEYVVRAHPRCYGELRERTERLQAHLDALGAKYGFLPSLASASPPQPGQGAIAVDLLNYLLTGSPLTGLGSPPYGPYSSPPDSSAFDTFGAQIAFHEATTYCKVIAQDLGLKFGQNHGLEKTDPVPAGLQWVSFTEYVTLWACIHEVEEALFQQSATMGRPLCSLPSAEARQSFRLTAALMFVRRYVLEKRPVCATMTRPVHPCRPERTVPRAAPRSS